MNPISSLHTVSSAIPTSGGPSKTGDTFAHALETTKQSSELKPKISGDTFSEIQKLENAVQKGTEMRPQDLLLYQIKVNRYAMQVELVSKVAESASSTIKKLQQG